jgi:energy-coupling factor transporter ATP-binding protein EcfA2
MVFKSKKQQLQYLVKTIRIIGDKGAGKTTYLTALASLYCDDSHSQVTRIVPSGKDTQNMIRVAKECLDEKEQIPSNDYGDGLEKSYVFKIEFKDSSILEIECKDYPGEFFQDLLDNKNPQLLEKYIKDCAVDGAGVLILLDGTAQQDEYYAECIYQLLVRLDRSTPKNSSSRRVAVALTKCDIPQLWIHRKNPTEKIRGRFEGVHGKLKNFQKITVDYFATSAYGMLGSDSEISNSNTVESDEKGTRAVIIESDARLWRPFGLIEPLYWLYTGKKY